MTKGYSPARGYPSDLSAAVAMVKADRQPTGRPYHRVILPVPRKNAATVHCGRKLDRMKQEARTK